MIHSVSYRHRQLQAPSVTDAAIYRLGQLQSPSVTYTVSDRLRQLQSKVQTPSVTDSVSYSLREWQTPSVTDTVDDTLRQWQIPSKVCDKDGLWNIVNCKQLQFDTINDTPSVKNTVIDKHWQRRTSSVIHFFNHSLHLPPASQVIGNNNNNR